MVRKQIGQLLIALCTIGLIWGGDVWALSGDHGDNTWTVQGYISQTANFGIAGDSWDTKQGFNQALTTLLLEGDYAMGENWTFYAAGSLVVDWAYEILSGDDDWKERHFNDSRSELFIDDEWWQLLKEAHVTWRGDNLMVRIGKQRDQALQQPNCRANFAAISRFPRWGTVETSEKLISAIDKMDFHLSSILLERSYFSPLAWSKMRVICSI